MAKKDKGESGSSIAKNRAAFYNYEVLQKLECGLVLTGTEVKSLREGQVAFADSFATIVGGELYLFNLNISEYKMGNRFNHVAVRKRKLLVHRHELRKLRGAIEQKGHTLVPLGMHWSRGMAKVELGVVRGKQMHDKRDTIKRKEQDREKQRVLRSYGKG